MGYSAHCGERPTPARWIVPPFEKAGENFNAKRTLRDTAFYLIPACTSFIEVSLVSESIPVRIITASKSFSSI